MKTTFIQAVCCRRYDCRRLAESDHGKARGVQLPAFRGACRPAASVAELLSPGPRTRATPGLRAAAHRVYPFRSLCLQVRKASEQFGGPGDKQYSITDSGVWSRRRTVSTGKSAHQYIQCQSEDVSDVAPSSVAASVSGAVLSAGVVESDWPPQPHSRTEQEIKARPHN